MAADIHIKRNHNFSADDLRARVTKAAEKLSTNYGVKTEWKGNTHLAFTATGVKGGIDLKDKEIEVKVELNFLTRALKGKIEEGVNKALDKELAPANA
jgi:putative polyhydroxyalkanoate system protein